jgi:hypothetical protein
VLIPELHSKEIEMSYPTNVEKELKAAGDDATVTRQEVDGTIYYTIIKDGRAFACVGYCSETGAYQPMRSNRY